MKSMTGFGRATNATAETTAPLASPDVELDISLRSVNGRFLEIRFHLPREYAGFESELKALIATVFSRGTMDLYVNRVRTAVAGANSVSMNVDLATQWLAAYRALGSQLKLVSQPSLDQLVKVPDVLRIEQDQAITESEKEALFKLVREAVQRCDEERVREGLSLSTELTQLCARLENLASDMEAMKADANSELEKRYRDRLQKLGFEGEVDDQRLAQEIVMQLDRADVSEELSRLREHLKAYRQLLLSPQSQGKKLDFYAQELLREVNTIGSKSHIAKLTGFVVDAKTVVEKIREQVQNVE
jgi:uncharacterized protein (TIGR00255 family)